MKTRNLVLLGVAAGLGTAFAYYYAVSATPAFTVTPNGPLDGGNFGPHTPGTLSSGIQEALNTGYSVNIIGPAVYPTQIPLTYAAPNQGVSLGAGVVVQPSQQLDGGVFQVISTGLSGIRLTGPGLIDANNLSMMGVWIAKPCPGFLLQGFELKNVRGIGGLTTASNPIGILAVGIGQGLIDSVLVHDISSPSYTGGNGACIWITGNIGISQAELSKVQNCQLWNTMNVAAGELIDGLKFDVNTIGLTAFNVNVHDTSGDGIEIIAGGTDPIYGPNKSNGHTVRDCTITNARYGLNVNPFAGGVALSETIDHNTFTANRSWAVVENDGADYITYTNNIVTSGLGRSVSALAGAHDILSGNVGF